MSVLSDSVTRINLALSPLDSFILKRRVVISKILLALSFASLGLLFFPALLKDTGSWTYFLLLFIIFLSPLSRITNIALLKKCMLFRKELGIWMGIMTIVHAGLFFLGGLPISFVLTPDFWVTEGYPSFLAWGMIATLLTIPLLVTSNIFSQKLLGRNWKHLHKLTYVVFVLVMLHIMFVTHQFVENGVVIVLYTLLKWLDYKNIRLGS